MSALAEAVKELKNEDFKMYYDIQMKRNIWVLGYFGGGAVNVMDAVTLASEYAYKANVSLGTVCIDEILSSRRFKGFKFLFSITPQEKIEGANEMDNVFAWLRS